MYRAMLFRCIRAAVRRHSWFVLSSAESMIRQGLQGEEYPCSILGSNAVKLCGSELLGTEV